MNPLFSKQAKLHRSDSSNINPQQQSKNSLKFVPQASYHSHLHPKMMASNIQDGTLFNQPKSGNQSYASSNLYNHGPNKFVGSVQYNLPNNVQHSLSSGIQNNSQSSIQNNFSNNFQSNEQNHQVLRQNRNNFIQQKLYLNTAAQKITKEIQSSREEHQNQKLKEKIIQLQLRIQIMAKQHQATKQQKKWLFNQYYLKIKQLESQIEFLKAKHVQIMLQKSQIIKNITICQSAHKVQTRNDDPSTYATSEGQKYRLLGKKFENKINQLYQENYKLKNTLILNQSRLQESETRNSALKILIQAFQRRDSCHNSQNNGQRLQMAKELHQLRQQNVELKQQNDRLNSEYDLQILKLQNTIQQMKQKGTSYQSLNDIKGKYKVQNQLQNLQCALKQQINQILRLKQKNSRLNKIMAFKSN